MQITHFFSVVKQEKHVKIGLQKASGMSAMKVEPAAFGVSDVFGTAPLLFHHPLVTITVSSPDINKCQPLL